MTTTLLLRASMIARLEIMARTTSWTPSESSLASEQSINPTHHVWKKAKMALLMSNVVLFCRHYQTSVETLGRSFDGAGGLPRQTSSVLFPSFVPLHRPQAPEQEAHHQYALALEQSLGFFDDIPDDVWRDVYWLRYHRTPRYLHPDDPDARRSPSSGWGRDDSTARWLYYNVIPNFSCPRLQKVGGLGDGPKWMCDVDRLGKVTDRPRRRLSPGRFDSGGSPAVTQNGEEWGGGGDDSSSGCLVYSIGSNGNYLFEDGLIHRLGPICEIHVFDPGSFERPDKWVDNVVYHPWGLVSSYDIYSTPVEGEYYSFQEIQRLLGHENRTVDIFKLDCEGCEWWTYLDWISANIRQILLETHKLPSFQTHVNAFGTPLPKLNASTFFDEFARNHFVLYHREVNSHHCYGECYEWSFLKLAPEFFELPV